MLITLAIPHPASLKPTPQLLWRVRHFFEFRRKDVCQRMRADDLHYIDELVQRWSPEWKVPPGETEAVKRALREPGHLEAAVAYYHTIGSVLLLKRAAEMRVW